MNTNLEALLLGTGLTIIAEQVVMLMGVSFSVLFKNAVVSVVLGMALVFGTVEAYSDGIGLYVAKYVFLFHLSLLQHFRPKGLVLLPPLDRDPVYTPPLGLPFSLGVLSLYGAIFIGINIIVIQKRKIPA